MTVIEDDCISVAPVAIENEEREEVVAFSYSNGLELKHTMSDDPHSFVGWEVHGKSNNELFYMPCIQMIILYFFGLV